jgi:aspartate kinase
MKFGGTSVQDAGRIRAAVSIVERHREQQPVVVVSAIGGATRELLSLAATALEQGWQAACALLAPLENRHRGILADLGLDAAAKREVGDTITKYAEEIEEFLKGIALLKQLTPQTQDTILAYGERFSTLLFVAAARSAGLDVESVDAATVMITDARFREARPDRAELATRSAAVIGPIVSAGRVPVTQGFIGATRNGMPTTMGFEASDYSASLLGAALGAGEIQIWTDVVGMLTTGHPAASDVKCVRELSFGEAAELSLFGAKVLHPQTVEPAIDSNIPVRIMHAANPDAPGTTIIAEPTPTGVPVKSIAVKEQVTTLRMRPLSPAPSHTSARTIAEIVDRYELSPILITTSGHRMVWVFDNPGLGAASDTSPALAAFRSHFDTACDPDCAIVSLVGEMTERAASTLARALRVLTDTTLHIASHGPSDASLSFVMPRDQAADAVCKLHDEFFGGAALGGLFASTEVPG